MVSGAVAQQVGEFISYALSVTSIMLIYYAIKFFLVPSEGTEAAEKKWSERGQKLGAILKDKFQSDKKKALEKQKSEEEEKSKQEKKEKTSPARDNLVKSIEAIDDAIHQLDGKDFKGAKESIKTFHDELKEAWGNLKTLRRKLNDTERATVQELVNTVEAINKKAQDEIIKPLPNTKKSEVGKLRSSLSEVRGMIGTVYHKLEKF